MATKKTTSADVDALFAAEEASAVTDAKVAVAAQAKRAIWDEAAEQMSTLQEYSVARQADVADLEQRLAEAKSKVEDAEKRMAVTKDFVPWLVYARARGTLMKVVHAARGVLASRGTGDAQVPPEDMPPRPEGPCPMCGAAK